jgi:hypothetical protein
MGNKGLRVEPAVGVEPTTDGLQNTKSQLVFNGLRWHLTFSSRKKLVFNPCRGLVKPMAGRKKSVRKTASKRKNGRAFYTDGGVRIRMLPTVSCNSAFQVDVPASVTGRRIQKQFKTKPEAVAYAEQMVATRFNAGMAGFALNDFQRSISRQALEFLRENEFLDQHLMEAVKFFVSHNRPKAGDVSVKDLAALYTREKENGTWAKRGLPLKKRSLDDLESRLRSFTEPFGDRLVKSLRGDEISDWLMNPEHSQQTRKNYHVVIGCGGRAKNGLKKAV